MRVTRPALERDDLPAVREWAKANGHPVSERGRVAPALINAFLAANPERARQVHLLLATATTPGAAPEDYTWQANSELGEIYTIVFARGLDEHQVLYRLGAKAEHIRMIEDGDHTLPDEVDIITAMRVGQWVIAIEDHGWRGVQREALSALSHDGGEAVAVMRHDYAARHKLAYAVDGALITDINPRFPAQRQGTDPDRLNRYLREFDIDPAAADRLDNPIPAALALASRITNVTITPQHLRRPVLGAAIPDAYF